MATVSEVYARSMPKPWKYKETAECVYPDLILGVEIETEQCRHGYDWYNEQFRTLGITTKEDGSLRRQHGLSAWEFITKPTATANLIPILKEFYRIGEFGENNYTDRCSVHVHANCVDMDMSHVINLTLIYTILEEILFEFVNNKPGSRDGYSRDTNIYCVPWNQCRDHYNLVQEFLTRPNEALARWQKYTALNIIPLHNYGTVEFRHMHGTADMVKLEKWLNIIGAMMKYARSMTQEELIKEINALNTTSGYEAFFRNVLANQLPYTAVYQHKLEEGVILAKYSLMSSRPKYQAKKKATVTVNPAPAAAPGGLTAMIMDALEPRVAAGNVDRIQGLIAEMDARAVERRELFARNQAARPTTARRVRLDNATFGMAQPRPVGQPVARPVAPPVQTTQVTYDWGPVEEDVDYDAEFDL